MIKSVYKTTATEFIDAMTNIEYNFGVPCRYWLIAMIEMANDGYRDKGRGLIVNGNAKRGVMAEYKRLRDLDARWMGSTSYKKLKLAVNDYDPSNDEIVVLLNMGQKEQALFIIKIN